ncbi:lysylphosphatidylglycerol synthase domain-containing protein [Haloarchaeobius amylolyticus]|uniref:lysylphosphatidylglycerol synthase domain-containing protein n=1 Tax=Haloarchaeobius amylolyticus TaxID=1198296 RepID=UPI002271CAAB
MQRHVRFVLGLLLGAVALAGYLLYVGPEAVLGRATAVAGWAVAVVAVLVLAEAAADGIGVWASIRPLNGGLSPGRSVQFAFAGDFFDVLSPAGPVSSEPIMAQFFAVATDTDYSEALGVRGVAKYVKSAAQLLLSVVLGGVILTGGSASRSLFLTLVGATVTLGVAGVAIVLARDWVARAIVFTVTPVLRVVSGLYRDDPYGRETVADAVARFRSRAAAFRDAPGLVALIAVGGLLEQLLTAGALWVALSGTGTGTGVALVAIVALVPLPRAASVVPIPGSLGAYDLLLAGALVAVTGVTATNAAAAVLIVRTFEFGVSLGGGGLAVAFLRARRS